MIAEDPTESDDTAGDEATSKDESASDENAGDESTEDGDNAEGAEADSASADNADESKEPDDGQPKTYDFSHPQHRLNKPLAGLSVGANKLSNDLSARIDNSIHVACSSSVVATELRKHKDISSELTNGSCVFEFNMELQGKGYIIIEPNLVFALVQSFFGGKEDYEFEASQRAPSTTETRLAGRLRDCILSSLGVVWGEALGFSMLNREPIAHDQFSAADLDSPIVATLQFELKFGTREANFSVLFPYQSLTQLHSNTASAGPLPENGQWNAGIQHELIGCELDIHGVLAETEITVNQLLKMQSGDFIPLGNVQTATFLTGSTPLFEAVIGASNGRVSASISHWLGHKDSTDGGAANEHFRK